MSKKNSKINYLEFVGFSTSSEAYEKIKEWSSNLSDDQYLIRSTILDIHAGIELHLRQIFFHYLKDLVFQTGEQNEDQKRMKSFEIMIDKLNFSTMHRILKPIFDSWPLGLSDIQAINDLRNQVAHRENIDKISYKGRNPFKDADSFAQLFSEAWHTRKQLEKFYERAIEDQRALAKIYYQESEKCRKEHKEK